ncbi:hypothetical protein DR64_1370 [Paraburkholderia xenovorans LB400]|jgi:hypothetical protein|uniref:DUF2844 domain-containing protein n=1 Tax=Paraburkholderia xenovorans (strain LB400) TaxID=266265 RepID=Q144C9_PARXL|nr:DUF2844 domain-containing protein [Paraburkholderia xenovorans]ABE29310.1 Hypothetical protein Bxe_A3679 [Paraburkholderia xenovorans LB400]AIP29689.1 hypothetical protein DR64_1370 [Paraburkholderia xenovorans LB400]NPT39687.1 DUF2844 domain-containing protein [Paraburkholderia xenovorans]
MRFSKIAMLAATLLPLASHATLGGAPGAGTSSPTVLRAVSPSAATAPVQPANAAPYSLHQSIDANGVTLREYALPGNVVFAVSWDGPIRPDMTALLGSYFPNFVNAGQSHARGTGPLVDGNDDFRIESSGRLGRFSGMAWLPRLMPAGVRPGDLQ